MSYILNKLKSKEVRETILFERLCEPLPVTFLSALAWVFGDFRWKVAFDLVVRPHNAYAILKAADRASALGLKGVSVLEFGVAAGAGLMNMALIAQKVEQITGVKVKVYGFDTGQGMPPAVDWRDHPDLYQLGDFPMDFDKLSRSLPSNCQLFIGDTKQNIAKFLAQLTPEFPVGYAVVDVDYYWSSKIVLEVFKDIPTKYLPLTSVYLDDIWIEDNNTFAGELLAVAEFNDEMPLRKIEHNPFLVHKRILRRQKWIRQLYTLNDFDHPTKFDVNYRKAKRSHDNPYLT